MWLIVQKGVLPVLAVLLLGACVARGLRRTNSRRIGARQRSNQQTVRVVLETVAAPSQGAFNPLTATSEPVARRRSIF